MNPAIDSRNRHFIINNMNMFTYKHFIKEHSILNVSTISNVSAKLHSLEEI